MFSRKIKLDLFIIVSIGMLLYSCANRGYPLGGPKDETPPIIVSETPENGKIGFNKTKLNIYFNEYVQLKDVNSKFIISPPQKKQPKVKLRGKRVLVEFIDSLRKNTTYSLDFGTSIVDNNEGNPLGTYRYYFSTGNHIDTMRVGGNVYDSYTRKPVENAYVMLYSSTISDSIPLREVPLYIARTDTAGYFSITNIKQQKYKLMAIEDLNKNFILESPSERVAFSDSIVFPIKYNLTKQDTTTKDTTDFISYIAYGPENLQLFMFKEEDRTQYLVNSERKERGLIEFQFSIKRTDSLKVKILDIETQSDSFIVERNNTNDTLKYWIKDTILYKRDSIRAELKYLKTDSLSRYFEACDTIDLNFKDEEIIIDNSKKGKKKKLDIDFLKIKFNINKEVDLNSEVKFETEQPILEDISTKLKLYKIESDTVKTQEEYKLIQDSIKIRKYTIDYKWEEGQKYSIEADSASIYSVFGKYNDKIERKFSIKTAEEYGTLILNLKNGVYPMILKLTEKNGKEYKTIKEIYPEKDGEYTIKYLRPGKYKFIVVEDANANQKWDTGYYLKNIQPENVTYIDKEVEIRENWDFEEELNFAPKKTKELEK